LIVGGRPGAGSVVRIGGATQNHPHQHIIHTPSLTEFGARRTLDEAQAQAGITLDDIAIAGIYDSYTITLIAFLEDLELAPRGGAADACRHGAFGPNGKMPINTHGGLMSFGHSGVGGGLAHIAEIYRQLARKAGDRQLGERKAGFVYGEGGLLSSQICLVLLQD
jgi:acetyl-CoA acetyltransferase